MNTYFIVKDNTIIDAIVWDGETEYTYHAPDCTMIPAIDNVGIGATLINGEWVMPEPVTAPVNPVKASAIEKLSALGLTQEEINALIGK